MLGEIVNRIAPGYDLDPRLVACVILQESGGNTFANRFETKLYQKLLAMPVEKLSGWRPTAGSGISLATEYANRATSWGCMQVLGETARWLCRMAHPFLTVLCDPEMGITAGCQVLDYYARRVGRDTFKTLDCYNSGRCDDTAGRDYAEKILRRLANREYARILTNA